MNQSAGRAIEQFAKELADLRRAAGSPSLRQIAASSKDKNGSVTLPHSTASDAVKGDHLPSLPVVLGFVTACHKFARSHHIAVDDEDFNRTKWQIRWTEVKELSQAGQADTGDRDAADSLDPLQEGSPGSVMAMSSRPRWIIGIVVTVVSAVVIGAGATIAAAYINREPKSSPSQSSDAVTVTSLMCSGPTTAHLGEVIYVSYEIEATTPSKVGLGAGLYPHGSRSDQSTGHGDNDQLQINAGKTSGTREVLVPEDLEPGRYELTVELWPPNQIGQEGEETLADQPCSQVTVS